jgi:hypothetical protein
LADVLGIDIGGVIITPARAAGDTSFFSSDYLATPPMADAFDVIGELSCTRFGANVHLVSKCGPGVEAKTRAWLIHHGFHAITGVPEERLHFCRERADKAPICKRLGVTHFIDDRLEVLGYLASVPHRFLFQPEEREVARHAAHLSRVRIAQSWREIATALAEPEGVER